MRKFICGLLIGFLIALPTTAFGGQALRLVVNGEDITAEAQPIIINGRTLVPARALAERLGAKVEWDASNQAVIISSFNRAPEEVIPQQPTEKEKTYKIGEEIQLGNTTIKCMKVSYTTEKMPSAPTPSRDEQYVVIEFVVKTNEEPSNLYHRPSDFIRSVSLDGKALSLNFFHDLNEKIYKGEQKTVTVYRLIPKNSKVDAIQFRGTYAGPFATVLLD